MPQLPGNNVKREGNDGSVVWLARIAVRRDGRTDVHPNRTLDHRCVDRQGREGACQRQRARSVTRRWAEKQGCHPRRCRRQRHRGRGQGHGRDAGAGEHQGPRHRREPLWPRRQRRSGGRRHGKAEYRWRAAGRGDLPEPTSDARPRRRQPRDAPGPAAPTPRIRAGSALAATGQVGARAWGRPSRCLASPQARARGPCARRRNRARRLRG